MRRISHKFAFAILLVSSRPLVHVYSDPSTLDTKRQGLQLRPFVPATCPSAGPSGLQGESLYSRLRPRGPCLPPPLSLAVRFGARPHSISAGSGFWTRRPLHSRTHPQPAASRCGLGRAGVVRPARGVAGSRPVRRRPDSNWCKRLCRPLDSRSPTSPERTGRLAGTDDRVLGGPRTRSPVIVADAVASGVRDSSRGARGPSRSGARGPSRGAR